MDTIEIYLRDIKREQQSDFLTAEEEIHLSRLIQGGDLDARNELVKRNLKFAFKVCKRFVTKMLPIEDLIGIADEALMKAADRYDGRTGKRFTTYAGTCIKNDIYDFIYNKNKMIRVAGNAATTIRKVKRGEVRIEDMSKEKLSGYKLALDASGKEREQDFEMDSIPKDKMLAYRMTADDLKFLEPVEKRVLKLYYQGELTHEEIGKIYGYTASWASSTCRKAIRKCQIEFRMTDINMEYFVTDAESGLELEHAG